jgi:RNA polymerase sigma factor (sigma-70 family)
MMTLKNMAAAGNNDAELVAACREGNRDAFGRIVTRYQSLICSLAYSATGCLGQSEDLAQETFITAWKHLRHLREPGKLRAWLCGIARNRINNNLRREGREPLRAAEPLDTVHDAPALEPLPSDHAISQEEEAILWRSLERIPEAYREPLVLFYREHQSIERVAEELELSQDAVKQRLSRGRKLLHEQVLAFVEGALERTNPGKAFTVGVLAALPALTISAHAATLGATAAKSTATAKAAGAMGLLGAFLSFPLVIFGNYVGYRTSLDTAQSDREREHIKSFYRKLVGCILGFSVAFGLLMFWARELISSRAEFFTVLVIGLSLAYGLAIVVLTIWELRTRRRLLAETAADESAAPLTKPAWEYRSHLNLFGLPFIHIRIGGDLGAQRKPVKAWIAVGDSAVGLLFAFGGIAIAPVSIGGCAVGLLPFGGCAVGLLALGGFSVGIWSCGGLAFGWQAFGGVAIAWSAAAGGYAIAHDFALGGIAQAAQANNEMAARFIRPTPFFQYGQIAVRHLVWLNLLWVIPMLVWWWAVQRAHWKNSHPA